jgi:adenine-specific DNA-methyltransferase
MRKVRAALPSFAPSRHPGALADVARLDASRKLSPARRAELGQYMTPASVATFMASLLRTDATSIRLLDAGAGVGSLTAAAVEALAARAPAPSSLRVDAWELDPTLAGYLRDTLTACEAHAVDAGVAFGAEVHVEDFVAAGVAMLDGGLFAGSHRTFNAAILNPPYHKIRSDSPTRHLLQRIGLETSNLYTAFLAVAVDLLEPGGELVAITPRSFCNGPYFRPFRERFLAAMRLVRVHVFERRDRAFEDDDVLQETVIFHAVKDRSARGRVTISSTSGPDDPCPVMREVPFEQVVHPDDDEQVIHIVADGLGGAVSERMAGFRTTLADLGLQVSTGRVVEFRAREHLRATPGRGTVPLVYPLHLADGGVVWPREGGRKSNAIVDTDATAALLLPAGMYVLTKRFSSKEEPRRIVAALYDPAVIRAKRVGFENHLNVFHRDGAGVPERLARGLAAWLNATLVDEHFRAWSGHTQVNATDLRKMPYPTLPQLEALGDAIGAAPASQATIDRAVEEVLFAMGDKKSSAIDPVAAKRRIEEALAVLEHIGLPREQQNERSALTLLALLDLTPKKTWAEATSPLIGITPMMRFFEQQYGKAYAPNTRETVRRFTVHQFLDAGVVLENPDEPARPTNSPKAVYQVEPGILAVLRAFGSAGWDSALATWLASAETLRARYAKERAMTRVPVVVTPGHEVKLSPGAHNDLVKAIIEEFCPRFTPGGRVLYVGDTGEKWAYFEREALAALGVTVGEHGKMPDVLVHHTSANWLVLVEAVTSHGPVSPKRRAELHSLFKASSAGLVFVTAFADRRAMTKYLGDISWETEVWIADAPSHMIHFNGERFLGPY